MVVVSETYLQTVCMIASVYVTVNGIIMKRVTLKQRNLTKYYDFDVDFCLPKITLQIHGVLAAV